MKKEVQKKQSQKRLGKILVVLLVVIVFFVVAVVAVVLGKLNKIKTIAPSDFVPVQEENFEVSGEDEASDFENVDPEQIEWPEFSPSQTPPKQTDGVTNILLIGQDTRVQGQRARSDSMILVSINKNTQTVKLVSFMRDLYVRIPGYSDNRLNAAYRFGGAALLDQTITENFGIPIDYNIEVDFSSFSKVIDMLGGVVISLSDEEAAYMNQKGYPQVHSGENVLDGQTALYYARIRKIGDGDFDRTQRQRTVLISLFNQVKTKDLSQLWALADTVFPLLATDMSNSEVLGTIFLVYTMGIGELQSSRVPLEGEYRGAKINGMAVLVPDLAQARQSLSSFLYE